MSRSLRPQASRWRLVLARRGEVKLRCSDFSAWSLFYGRSIVPDPPHYDDGKETPACGRHVGCPIGRREFLDWFKNVALMYSAISSIDPVGPPSIRTAKSLARATLNDHGSP